MSDVLPGVGFVRYRHFAIVCSCGAAHGSDVELTEEQVALIERDATEGLRLIPRAEAVSLATFYREHALLGHEPVPSLVGPLGS
jgi:hypothetical protein